MNDQPVRSEQTKDIIYLFTHYWETLEEKAGLMTYADYMEAIIELHTATNDIDQTKAVFAAVVTQAHALGKSLEWVQDELKFETEAVGNRTTRLQADLVAQAGSDCSLDNYNLRMSRFSVPQ